MPASKSLRAEGARAAGNSVAITFSYVKGEMSAKRGNSVAKKKKQNLKAKAAYYARPLVNRPADMAKLKERQTLRAEHIAGQAAVHARNERDRIKTMLNEHIAPQLRATLLKNMELLKK